MSGPQPLLILRTSSVMYALFGGISGGVFVLAVTVALTKEPAFWIPTMGTGIVLAAFLSWMATTTLTLTADFIHYRSLLVTTDVLLADVIEAKFVAGFSSFKPYQRLIVTVREKNGSKDITINTGLFDRAEIKRWMDSLNARLSRR